MRGGPPLLPQANSPKPSVLIDCAFCPSFRPRNSPGSDLPCACAGAPSLAIRIASDEAARIAAFRIRRARLEAEHVQHVRQRQILELRRLPDDRGALLRADK